MKPLLPMAAAMLLSGALATAGQTYVATDLGEVAGSPDSYSVWPTGINNYGQVVGRAEAGHGGSVTHPFLWTPLISLGTSGTMTDLGLLPDPLWGWGGAAGINTAGQVVGYSGNANTNQAFLWTPSTPNGTTGTLIGLPNPSGTYTRGRAAGGINDAGQVLGITSPPAGDVPTGGQTAFVWTPAAPGGSTGSLIDIVDTAASNGSGFTMSGINSAGQFVSNCDSGPSLWTPAGGAYNQTILSGIVQVNAINNRGQIIGYTRSGQYIVPFVWTPATPNGTTGSIRVIGVGTANANAWGINEQGQVVGAYAVNTQAQWSAYLWDPTQGSIDLNDALVNPMPGWTLTSAVGLNDNGEIIATGVEFVPLARGGGTREIDHAFLLTPGVPEPVACAPLLALLQLALARRTRNRKGSAGTARTLHELQSRRRPT